jgi:predicted GNAT family N-acyltransferase
MNAIGYRVRLASWPHEQHALRGVRTRVFVEEQRVPASLEWDNEDDGARHFIAEDDQGRPIGTARLLPSGQIGRMAVEREWRGRGVGDALLKLALTTAEAAFASSPFLNAQIQVVPFYARLGFRPMGERFLEAGILHQRMVLETNERD